MGRAAEVAFLLCVAVFFYLASPPTPDAAVELIQLRARDLLGLVPPGEGTPTYPGWVVWLGMILAAFLWPVHALFGGGATQEEFLQRTLPLQATVLRAIASLLAAACVGLSLRVLRRLLGPAKRMEDGQQRHPLHLSSLGPGGIALVVTLLLAPLLADGVARVSPALLGGALWLVLTRAVLDEVRPGDLRWGAVSGVWLGVLLGVCGWLWPTVPVFLAVALIQRRGAGQVLAAFVAAIGVGMALDPARLLEPSAAGPRFLTEWSRAGGWNLASAPLGSQSLLRLVTLSPLVGWVAGAGAVISAAFWVRGRRADLLVWWGGLGLAALVLPVATGIRSLEVMQQTWALLLLVAAAAGVGQLALGIVSRRREAWWVGFALVLGAGYARMESAARLTAMPPGEVVRFIAEIVPADARVLAERRVPGLDAVCRPYTLPRDSRLPERFGFVYWPEWYAGFDYVLLSEVQVQQNASRSATLHFYGQLRGQGELIGRTGPPGSGWVLYRIPDASEWRVAPTSGELSQLTVVPELLQFLDQLGTYYAQTGTPGLARTFFQAGLELDPTRDSFYNNLGSVYLLESEWEEAARVFENGLRRNPRSAELSYNAGRAFFELGSFARAESLLRRAVGLRPDFADAHYELARAFLAQDKMELARVALEAVLSLGPSPERQAAVEFALEQLRTDRSTPTPPPPGTER